MVRVMGLRSRLFCSHMLVMVVSLSCYIISNRLATFHHFAIYLEDLVLQQTEILHLRSLLAEGFSSAWYAGVFWSLTIGALAALLLSFWVAQRITAPLIQMEQMTRAFAAGALETRLPTHSIPEINRLGRSFNRMALSLDQVEQKRRDLVGDLAHELRTPLTIIRGYLEELADERLVPTAETFHRIIREVRRLERLVSGLQLLSKAEAGHLSLQLEAISVRPLLEQLIETFSTQLREGGPTLVLTCPTDLPPVWADRDRTEQVLVNLVGNALRYTERGQITLQADYTQQQVWFTVADTGPGIAPHDLPYVFDRFWRSQQSRARYSGGSGLGLAITRRLVELQGGRITVESQLGVGSTFQFALPMAKSINITQN